MNPEEQDGYFTEERHQLLTDLYNHVRKVLAADIRAKDINREVQLAMRDASTHAKGDSGTTP